MATATATQSITLPTNRQLNGVTWKNDTNNSTTLTGALKRLLKVEKLDGIVLTKEQEKPACYLISVEIRERSAYGAENVLNDDDATDAQKSEAKTRIIGAYGSIENYQNGEPKLREVVCKFSLDYATTATTTDKIEFVMSPTKSQYDTLVSYVENNDEDEAKNVEIDSKLEIVNPKEVNKKSTITDHYARLTFNSFE